MDKAKVVAVVGIILTLASVAVVFSIDSKRDCSQYHLIIAGEEYEENWSGIIRVNTQNWSEFSGVLFDLKGPAPAYFIRFTPDETESRPVTATTPTHMQYLSEGTTVIEVYAIGEDGRYPSKPTTTHTITIESPFPPLNPRAERKSADHHRSPLVGAGFLFYLRSNSILKHKINALTLDKVCLICYNDIIS